MFRKGVLGIEVSNDESKSDTGSWLYKAEKSKYESTVVILFTVERPVDNKKNNEIQAVGQNRYLK
jgi:hypothetical protein